MIEDSQQRHQAYQRSLRPHAYGEQIKILHDPFLLTRLARLCSPECVQPEFNALLTEIYSAFGKTLLNYEFPQSTQEIATRMHHEHMEAVFRGSLIDPSTKVVIVDLARAGIVPANVLFELFTKILLPQNVRVDHIFINRSTDQESKVTGADIHGTKIGGSIEDAIVLIPDPMGATGSSISNVINFYAKNIPGKAKKWFAMNLIITPEYIQNLLKTQPDLSIYAVRLDRAFSSARALQSLPGQYPDEERGLNEKQYIVPGGGGFGELSTNSYV